MVKRVRPMRNPDADRPCRELRPMTRQILARFCRLTCYNGAAPSNRDRDLMPSVFETAPATSALPITFATKATWETICSGLPAQARQFATANGFAAKPGSCLTLPDADGQIAQVLFGLEDETSKSRDLFRPGLLPGLLPAGIYRFANTPHDMRLATLAFALGSYRFNRYRKNDAPGV